jgi:PKHD-type hydroxylase
MELPKLYLHVQGLLTPDEVARLRQIATEQSFEDGRKTASLAAVDVKRNLQLVKEKPLGQNEFELIILNAMQRNPLISGCVMPKAVYPPMISKYEVGMSYGWHIDSPLMGPQPVRTDLAMTLFLNDPQSYEGGALAVQSPAGLTQFRLPAGDAIFYPANRLHCVTEVTKGTRLCAITWIQSVVRDHEKREMIFTMNYLYSLLSAKDLHSPESQITMGLYSNLLRRWGE